MSRLPDKSKILRSLLEVHALRPQIMAANNATLAKKGLILKIGTFVDAPLIAVPSSTKNKDAERDSEMHQTKKGNQWHFGIKAHIGVDADSGLVQSEICTAANVNEVTQGHNLLYGLETVVFADARNQGEDKRPGATDLQWQVAIRPSKRRTLREAGAQWGALLDHAEKLKASVSAKVGHPFRVIKRQCGHTKVNYRWLTKNTEQLFTLSNLWMVRKRILEDLQT